MSFIHIIPGWVDTPGLRSVHWTLRPFVSVMALAARSVNDCGEWMNSALVAPEYQRGAFHLSEKAEPIAANKIGDMDMGRSQLVEHYQETVAV